jgi:hypothetical protein
VKDGVPVENVENYEITWEQGLISIAFTDLFGVGDSFRFTPQEMTKVRDGITAALNLYRVDFPGNKEELDDGLAIETPSA